MTPPQTLPKESETKTLTVKEWRQIMRLVESIAEFPLEDICNRNLSLEKERLIENVPLARRLRKKWRKK